MSCPFCNLLAQIDQLPHDQLVGQFQHSVALLGPWQYFTGYCILVSRQHATELFELSEKVHRGFLNETTQLAHALYAEFQPRKMNYELLGNQIPHLHWHLIPRYASDPDHLKPAWLAIDRAERDADLKSRLIGDLNRDAIAARIRDRLRKAKY